MSAAAGTRGPDALVERWRAAWPKALEAWSSYTLLRDPTFFEDDAEAAPQGWGGEIAAIRLTDQTVGVNLATIREKGLEDHALAVLAHEVGHHVYVPGNLADNARMLATMQRALTGLPPARASLVSNLYADLLINDRLQRRAGLDMAAVYRKLKVADSKSGVWRIYTRICEHLWRLPDGSLAPAGITRELDADAQLGARMIRSFAGDWLRGARRFASLLYPYLAEDEEKKRQQPFEAAGLSDLREAGKPGQGQDASDAIPDGLTGIDPWEESDDDDFDDDILDPLGEKRQKKRLKAGGVPKKDGKASGGGQFRQPFEYGQLLKNLGLNLDEHEVTTRYYRERALPYLVPFPARKAPHATEPLAEGYETWEAAEPLEELDLLGSVVRSPVLIPGVSTVKRVYGETPGSDPAKVPLDLDIYVDSSGSMPNPGVDVSYLALAGVILALSALRAGARCQATLWSGAGQFETTGGFVRDEKTILGILTGYMGDGTAFPLSVLRETYASRKKDDPPAHVVVISDDGADTMLQRDEKATPGEKVCAVALERARGGGTLALNLIEPERWRGNVPLSKIGFAVHGVTKWEDLVEFARAFVRENYGKDT